MKKLLLPFTMALTAALFVTACGSGTKNSSIIMETTAAPAAENMAADTNEVRAGGAYEDYEQAMSSESYDSGSTADLKSEFGQTAAVPSNRKLIRTVSLQVETDTFDALLAGINAKLAELGGYIEYSDISGTSLTYSGDPIPKNATLKVRVPDDKLPGFITTVETSGNVTNKTESTEDVTLKYSDLESRKKSLEIEQERIWQFLEKAETIDTVITLEQRLSDIRYELESMESQLRLYDNQVSYSTVNLNIYEVTKFTSTAPKPVSIGGRITDGLTDNFTSVVTALTNLLVTLITTSPYWVLLLIIALIIWKCVQRHPRKPRPSGPSTSSVGGNAAHETLRTPDISGNDSNCDNPGTDGSNSEAESNGNGKSNSQNVEGEGSGAKSSNAKNKKQ